MRPEKQAFAQMVLGLRRNCMDFGECTNVMCTYNHSIPPGGITVPPVLLVRSPEVLTGAGGECKSLCE